MFAAPMMAGISMMASAGGAVIGAMGAHQQARSNSAMSLYQAQVAENNKTIAEQNAAQARLAGGAEAERHSFKVRALLGAQKAAQAAKGVDVNYGSPVDVRASTADLGMLDTLTILSGAESKAHAYKAQAMGFEAERNLDVMKADNYRIAGRYAVASSLIGGASSVSDKWSTYKTRGVF